MYINAILDADLMSELRKYWKEIKKIDYRWIIEIKEVIESTVKAKDQYNSYRVRMETEKVIIKALQDYSMKKIIDSWTD